MLPRRLPQVRQDRMGWMRTTCRRRHALRVRRRPLHLWSGHPSCPRQASKCAVALPPLTSVAIMETVHEPEPTRAVNFDPGVGAGACVRYVREPRQGRYPRVAVRASGEPVPGRAKSMIPARKSTMSSPCSPYPDHLRLSRQRHCQVHRPHRTSASLTPRCASRASSRKR